LVDDLAARVNDAAFKAKVGNAIANGVMDPSRLYESPYIDHGHLDVIFPHEVGTIVKILRDVKAHALSADVA
jgi:type I restriction enzyme, R subunit